MTVPRRSRLSPAQHAACSLYASGFVVLFAALHISAEPTGRPLRALDRGLQRGELQPGVPRLDPSDPMANAAMLMTALDEVGHPGFGDRRERCQARPRSLALLLDRRLSRVRFGERAVCQLRRLKEISMAQPGFGERGLGEVAAFVLGRRLPGGSDVDVTRIVVPPFRFTRDTLTFVAADLGPLQKAEQFIGTYHTHPEGDLEQGVLSEIDLQYMHDGNVDFHGRVGPLQKAGPDADWLFDVVEPRDGDWNVYAHDQPRLFQLLSRCQSGPDCPVNELRLAGSPFYLLTRYYEERDTDY